MLCYTKFNSFIQFQKVVVVYHVAIEEIDIDIWTARSIWLTRLLPSQFLSPSVHSIRFCEGSGLKIILKKGNF